MSINYIGADVHAYNTELSVEKRKKIVNRYSVPTTISAITDVLKSISGEKHLVIEEGPMAGWLYRNLHTEVDNMVVCDPRRNKYVYADGDVDDIIAADKLAELLRGGYLRPVYHSDDEERIELKHWVALYHDRVRTGVSQINKIRARCRMHGIRIPRNVIRDVTKRDQWLSEQTNKALAMQIKMLWIGYDATVQQVKISKTQLIQLSKKYEIIQYWKELPGLGLIRSVTLFAFLETPWRFKKKTKLWKYCGLGIHRITSGKDRWGRPKPAHLALERYCNRRLKDAVLGAVNSAIHCRTSNIFKDYYERLLHDGKLQSNARHSTGRLLLNVTRGMWKTMSRFDPNAYQPETDT